MSSVACSNCGAELPDDTSIMRPPLLSSRQRKPCPKCGSTARTVNLSVSLTVGTTMQGAVTVTLEKATSQSSLLVQAVVLRGSQTSEGQLIEAITIPWLEIVKLLQADPTIAFQIPASKWEEIIAGAYKKSGFDEVTLTPRSGDYGRDVIAVKKGIGTIRVIDQVKAYKPGHLVTADDVRALMGVLLGDGASKGFLTTTSDFAPRLRSDPLLSPFMPSRLELIDGKTLLTRLGKIAESNG